MPDRLDEHAARPAIVVRRPAIDLDAPSPDDGHEIPRDWWGGDPFRTHFLNALSSTFPFGEAFFVRSVRRYADRVGDPALRRAIRDFAAQEGQHSRLHDDHLALLVRQGHRGLLTRNRIVDRLLRWHNRRTPRLSLAATAAFEHLTAILARQLLVDASGWAADMDPVMATLWRWHALEEAEHKAVAFDVMEAVQVPRWMRIVVMALSTPIFAVEVLDRMIYMLWRDGRLFDAGLWARGFRFLLGKGGFLRGSGPAYRAWYRADFHPDHFDDRALIARMADDLAPQLGS
jgi:predicted metal-dependent hydrolase